jgi:hypothetical protein
MRGFSQPGLILTILSLLSAVGVEILGFRRLPNLDSRLDHHQHLAFIIMSEKKSLKLKFKGEKSHKKHKTGEESGSRKRKREEENSENDTGW